MMIKMQLIVLILLTIVPTAYCKCHDNKDCHSCASSSQFLINCRWCEMTSSCHAPGSKHNDCHTCKDVAETSTLCSVTDPLKCGQIWTKGKDFDPQEAYNATLYSALAYSDNPVECANKALRAESIEIVEVIGRKCEYLFKYKECVAIAAVSHSMQKIIIAYRGTTNTKQLIDEFATTLGKFKVSTKIGGNIQAYFSNANDQLYSCVHSCVEDLVKKYPTYRLFVAGHSLGGAIASIASAQLVADGFVGKEKTTLYTFGMPRPGDKKYAEQHDKIVKKSWRIVHFRDVVSKVPAMTAFSTSPYHHQREIFYGKVMHVSSGYIYCLNYEDKNCGRSVWPSSSSIDYHKTYYGINVGSHCDEIMNIRQKRSDADSDMSHHFTSDKCKRIPVSVMTSSGTTLTVYGAVGVSFMMFFRFTTPQ